jgi:hypothetical protein
VAFDDLTHDLVAGYKLWPSWRKFALDDVQVGSTHATGANPQ